MIELIFTFFQGVCLAFFVGINSGYILLNILSFISLPRYLRRQVLHRLPHQHTDFEPPISLIVTAFNEETVIVESVRSLLQLDYPEFEIVIVNDGSKDGTLEVLKKEFSLVKLPEAFRQRLQHAPVRGIYQSTTYSEIRVIDKENGGSKADASNAGINGARNSLFCPLDADTVLERDSMKLLVQPFLEDPTTVAVGGTVRIANGCEVSGGFLGKIGLPTNLLALFQILEYLRAFILGRVGWEYMDALPLISGAFGLFHKETVIKVGGYKHDSLGEDMELVLRIHKHFRLQGIPYRVTYVADPACWTEAPETLGVLRRQRVRWGRGLIECLLMHRELLFHPKAGALGWGAIPFLFFFEGFGVVIEVFGYITIVISFLCGQLAFKSFAAGMLLAISLGLLLSFTALLLEEMTFHTYPKFKHLLILFGVAIIENFGYRQLTTFWRFEGLVKHFLKTKSSWGVMTRKGFQSETQKLPLSAEKTAVSITLQIEKNKEKIPV